MWITCCKVFLKQLKGAPNSMFVNCALHADFLGVSRNYVQAVVKMPF